MRVIIFLLLQLIAQLVWAWEPVKPITVTLPLGPGSGPDIAFRPFLETLRERGIPVFVEYKPAAGGIPAFNDFRKKEPDGYHLMVTLNSGFFAVAYLMPDSPRKYELSDFEYVSILASTTHALIARPGAVKTVADFIQDVRFNSRTISVGSMIHELGIKRLVFLVEGKNPHLIKYSAPSGVVTDVANGSVHYGLTILSSVIPVQDKVSFLGVTHTTRLSFLPDVPAISETVPGFMLSGSWGLVLPRGTPQEIRDYYEKLVREVSSYKRTKKYLDKNMLLPSPLGPLAFSEEVLRLNSKFTRR
jgi:tripartite-type tricarboxylate transporter receptor subunit TctC